MGLPVHKIGFSINPEKYYYKPEIKQTKIVYIGRKGQLVPMLKRVLSARNPDYTKKIIWRGLDNLSEDEYATEIRESSIFLNLSTEEGLVNSCLEAMSSGSIVVGFNSIGGQGMLKGEGLEQNCILAQNGDYITLAYKMEKLLIDLIAGSMSRWETLIENSRKLTSSYTLEAEQKSILSFWSQIIDKTDSSSSSVK